MKYLSVQTEPPHLPPPVLSTSERHRKIREEANVKYRRNAERMKIQYTKHKRHKVKMKIYVRYNYCKKQFINGPLQFINGLKQFINCPLQFINGVFP